MHTTRKCEYQKVEVHSAGPTYLISEGLRMIDAVHEAGVVERAAVENTTGRRGSAEGHE